MKLRSENVTAADVPAGIPVVIVNRLGHYAESHLVHFDDKSLVGIQYLLTYAGSMISMVCSLNQHHKVTLFVLSLKWMSMCRATFPMP